MRTKIALYKNKVIKKVSRLRNCVRKKKRVAETSAIHKEANENML